MCTYNGGKYIKEQVQSIVDNTAKDWKLFVFDDQSTDNTLEIIDRFEKKYPDKIIVKVNKIKKGAIVNFLSSIYDIGLKMKDNDFIMPCDQDDVWNANKIQKISNVCFTYLKKLNEHKTDFFQQAASIDNDEFQQFYRLSREQGFFSNMYIEKLQHPMTEMLEDIDVDHIKCPLSQGQNILRKI